MSKTRAALTSFVAIAAMVFAYSSFDSPNPQVLDQSSFYRAVTDGRINEVTMVPDEIGYRIRGTLNSDAAESFTTYILAEPNLLKVLDENRVSVKAEPPGPGPFLSLLSPLLFLLLIGGVGVFFIHRMRQQSGGVQSLSRSRAKLYAHTGKTTFKDVAGVEEAKQELEEIIEFLKKPAKFQKLGGKIPTGVLLTGPPGTGKTLLARAVAGEADVPFFSVSGSDFVEMFVGIGASRMRDLFEQGRKNGPCIVFIDELDAVGGRRGAGVGGGHDEREQTLNQLLVELDGFESHDGVIVLAATNRPDVLDPALLRPGRFDRQVVVGRPDLRGREEIIKIHSLKVPLHPDVELGFIARGTPGFSGAELANLVNEAALHAAVHDRETVTLADFEHARDKGLMGSARHSLVISEEEQRAMAYRQAGHALLAFLLPESDPVHKVTIIPRGLDLGTTQQIPTGDRYTESRPYLLAKICGLMGGRVAEDLQLNRISSDAGKQFEQATTLARKMVTEWGMSESMGPLAYGKSPSQSFLGREIAQRRDYSEATAREIDREISKIVMSCYAKAHRILKERSATLISVAEALLLHETLNSDQIAKLAAPSSAGVAPTIHGELAPA